MSPGATAPPEGPTSAAIVIEERLVTRWLVGVLALACATIPLGGRILRRSRWRQGLALGVLAAAAALLMRVVVRVVEGPEGRALEIVYGNGIIRQSIAASEMERVDTVSVAPWRWGGWGYRGSMRLLGRAALVTRGGPALRVTLRNGRRFEVTVDEPDAFVEALRAA